MRTGVIGAALFLIAVPATAELIDPYGVQSDVIGSMARHDIKSLSLSLDQSASNVVFLNILIEMNYNLGDTALGSMSLGSVYPTLQIGDLLFSDDGDIRWGVALRDRTVKLKDNQSETVQAGVLYEIGGAWNARQVLGNPANVIYRPDSPVWMKVENKGDLKNENRGGTPGTISVEKEADWPYLLSIALNIPVKHNSDFIGEFPDLDVHLAAATCGNDILEGSVRSALVPDPVPEPSAMILFGTVAGGFLLRRLARFGGGRAARHR